MHRRPLRPAARLPLGALLLLALASGRTLAQDAAPDSAAPRAVAPVASRGRGRLLLDSMPPGTRVRLVAVGLTPRMGTSIEGLERQQTFLGTLVRIETEPSHVYVVQTARGEWTIPRSSLAAAAHQVGTRSRSSALLRSTTTGTLLGALAGSVYGAITSKGAALPGFAAAGLVTGALLGTRPAGERWQELRLPPRRGAGR